MIEYDLGLLSLYNHVPKGSLFSEEEVFEKFDGTNPTGTIGLRVTDENQNPPLQIAATNLLNRLDYPPFQRLASGDWIHSGELGMIYQDSAMGIRFDQVSQSFVQLRKRWLESFPNYQDFRSWVRNLRLAEYHQQKSRPNTQS